MDHCLWQGWSFAVIPFTTTIKQMYNCRTGQFPSTKKQSGGRLCHVLFAFEAPKLVSE